MAGVLWTPGLRDGMTGVFCRAALLPLRRCVPAVLVVSTGRLLLGRRLRLGPSRALRRRMIAMPGMLILHLTKPMLAVVLLRGLRRLLLRRARAEREQ